ncbi:MAG: SAM-dependent chlorinase/fluorinase [Tissierellia bacterium]|nr:SAM-dependent chlorinase/fluorinase [Tissierellia bacterium]
MKKKLKQKLVAGVLASSILLGIVSPVSAKPWYQDAFDFLSKENIELSDQLTAKEAAKKLSTFAGEDLKVEASEESMTREQLAAYVMEALKIKGIITNSNTDLVEKNEDFDQVDKDLKEAVAALYNLKIMVGDGIKLLPKEEVHKNQFAQVLKALYDVQEVKGTVASVSKHGNVQTDIPMENLEKHGIKPGDLLTIKIHDENITAPYGDTYSNVDNGKEVVLPDAKHTKNMIVAINMADFSKTYGAKEGDGISLTLQGAGLYLEEYNIRNIDKQRTYERQDYKSDEVYANFREITAGNIQPKTLYRTSSPIDPELNRAAYADRLIQKAEVKTVLNFAQTEEEVKANIQADTFDSPYYKELFEKGQVMPLSMGVDFSQDEFNEKLKKGLEFMIAHEGPYAIHCTEGKDRAGFVSALLEMLGGATQEEIIEDYMVSYINFFHVEKDSKQYHKIIESNIEKTLMMVAGVDSKEALAKVNLQEAATRYLEEKVGLSSEEVTTLTKILTGKEKVESIEDQSVEIPQEDINKKAA